MDPVRNSNCPFKLKIPREEFEHKVREELNKCKMREGETCRGAIYQGIKAVDLIQSMPTIPRHIRIHITDLHKNQTSLSANAELLAFCECNGKFAELVAAMRANGYEHFADLIDPEGNCVLQAPVSSVEDSASNQPALQGENVLGASASSTSDSGIRPVPTVVPERNTEVGDIAVSRPRNEQATSDIANVAGLGLYGRGSLQQELHEFQTQQSEGFHQGVAHGQQEERGTRTESDVAPLSEVVPPLNVNIQEGGELQVEQGRFSSTPQPAMTSSHGYSSREIDSESAPPPLTSVDNSSWPTVRNRHRDEISSSDNHQNERNQIEASDKLTDQNDGSASADKKSLSSIVRDNSYACVLLGIATIGLVSILVIRFYKK